MGERQRIARPEEMATTSTAVATVTPQIQEEPVSVAVITLRPTRTETRKKVVWTEDTVDNEHMNKKKSKCCCIYEKPHKFDESDSEDSDDECEHCFGHVEKKHGKHQHQHQHTEECAHQSTDTGSTTVTVAPPTPEPTTTIKLTPGSPAPAPTPPPDKKDQ